MGFRIPSLPKSLIFNSRTLANLWLLKISSFKTSVFVQYIRHTSVFVQYIILWNMDLLFLFLFFFFSISEFCLDMRYPVRGGS